MKKERKKKKKLKATKCQSHSPSLSRRKNPKYFIWHIPFPYLFRLSEMENLGTPWNPLEHLGTLRSSFEHFGTPCLQWTNHTNSDKVVSLRITFLFGRRYRAPYQAALVSYLLGKKRSKDSFLLKGDLTANGIHFLFIHSIIQSLYFLISSLSCSFSVTNNFFFSFAHSAKGQITPNASTLKITTT